MDHDWMSSDSKAASMGSHDHTAMMASSGVETHDSMTHMMQVHLRQILGDILILTLITDVL